MKMKSESGRHSIDLKDQLKVYYIACRKTRHHSTLQLSRMKRSPKKKLWDDLTGVIYKLLLLTCVLSLSSPLLAQDEGIQTTDSLSVEELVKNQFIRGNCRNVNNITAIGDETLGIGQFNNGANIINLSDGILISTGDIDLAKGPNESSESSYPFNTTSNDPDLSLLATSDLYDATGIEFDFTPLGDRVSFRYVFASEEYCEFVGTSFNDVFGFFVSGPGINGPFEDNAINVAKLIGTNEDVSINTVNHLSNVNSYINNVTNLDAEACDITFSPEFENFIEYDGFTIPLTASFAVVPCERYHIRIVIGDVGDANLDSAVFLESNSFDLGEGVVVYAEVPGRDEPIAYENCTDGQYVFTRTGSSSINEDLTVQYVIGAGSEAIAGVDFLDIPRTVTIPAGENAVVVPVTIIDDNVLEGPERLELELRYDCNCIDPVFSELIIDEAVEIAATLEDVEVCGGQEFSISPEISGGVSPYQFLWETGITTEVFQGSIMDTTMLEVEVIDFCGDTTTAAATLAVQPTPSISLSGTYNLCEVIETGIALRLEGNAPWTIGYSIDGIQQNLIENIQSDVFNLPVTTEGNYEISVFTDAFCEGVSLGNALVESSLRLETEIIQPSCYNSSDGRIEITQLEAVAPFTLGWNTQVEDKYLLDGLSPNRYVLTITDGDGCTIEKSFDLSDQQCRVVSNL